MIKHKIYNVILKDGNKKVRIKASNGSNAINIAKKRHFQYLKNINNSHFKVKLVPLTKIEKTGIGEYSLIDLTLQYNNVVLSRVSLSRAKSREKELIKEKMKHFKIGVVNNTFI